MKQQISEEQLEKLLERLPGGEARPELAGQIYQIIHRHHQRQMKLRLAISAFLAVIGFWLATPDALRWLSSLRLPADGLPVLVESASMVLQDAWIFMVHLADGLISSQNAISALSAAAVPGLIALAIGALILLGTLIPRAG